MIYAKVTVVDVIQVFPLTKVFQSTICIYAQFVDILLILRYILCEKAILVSGETCLASLWIFLVTAWKVPKYGVFSGPYFPVFGLNTGKYGPEKTPYLDTFHALCIVRLYNLIFQDIGYKIIMSQKSLALVGKTLIRRSSIF